MNVPLSRLREAVRQPRTAVSYVSRNPEALVDELVVTPLRSRYLFGREWDLAIVLDACRYDLGVEAARRRDWLPEPERVWSAGAHSAEWMQRTFESAPADVLRGTVYVSGNQYTATVLDGTELEECDEVWRYGWDEDRQCVPPRPVTDRTISAIRRGHGERYVAHYMQPHLPPLDPSDEYDGSLGFDPSEGWFGGNPWKRTEAGEVDPETIRAAYWGNMEGVLDDVELLLENADVDDVVITADHGNYLGEGGNWGHRSRNQFSDAVRAVPWWEVSAADERTHTPATYETEADKDRGEILDALGYR